jgi:hypothetical protein
MVNKTGNFTSDYNIDKFNLGNNENKEIKSDAATDKYIETIKNNEHSSNNRICKIEIIAAGREKNLTKQITHYIGHKLGVKGSRGEHVFIGHTAIHVEKGGESYSTGFSPRICSIADAIKFMATVYLDFLLGKPTRSVEGEWTADEAALLADPKLSKFGFQVSEDVALEFEKFTEQAKSLRTNYMLQPGSELGTAAVYRFANLKEVNPAKIKGRAVVLVNNEHNKYNTYVIENKKIITDNSGNHIRNEIIFSEEESKALLSIKSGKKLKNKISNVDLINKVIDKAVERTDLNWGENSTAKNCVNYALHVFVDFFLEYNDKSDDNGQPYFTESEKEEISQMLNDILQATASRSYCGQTALLKNIELWEGNRLKRQTDNL